MKEIILKICKRCGTSWFDNPQRITLYPGETVDLLQIKIPWCLNCANSYEKEFDQVQHRKAFKNEDGA